MRVALGALLALATAFVIYIGADFSALSHWVVDQQREFQNQMAFALQALRAGDTGAYVALLTATGAYGFVHALGPGHGKYLVSGVGLGTTVSAPKLTGIAVISSLLQAMWAIVLVYGGFALVEASAQQLTFLANDVLAPVSYAAIGVVGLILTGRGFSALMKRQHQSGLITDVPTHVHHEHGCGCGHKHGPTPDEVANIGSFKEAALLVASVAVRPCTGALFLLVIAWQMDIAFAGAVGVMVMGLGTAALTSLVALSSIFARQVAFVSADASGIARVIFPAGQIFAGALIFLISVGLLVFGP